MLHNLYKDEAAGHKILQTALSEELRFLKKAFGYLALVADLHPRLNLVGEFEEE